MFCRKFFAMLRFSKCSAEPPETSRHEANLSAGAEAVEFFSEVFIMRGFPGRDETDGAGALF